MNKLVTLFAAAAMLASTAVLAEPAVHISAFSCGLLDGDGAFYSTTDSKVTFSNNGQDGNYIQKCSAKGLDNSTGGAVRYDFDSTGFSCGVVDHLGNLHVTLDWFINVSADGNATLTCKVNFNDF